MRKVRFVTFSWQIPVEIGRDASFKELRSLLGKWMNVPAENVRALWNQLSVSRLIHVL